MEPITHIYDRESGNALDLWLPKAEKPPLFIYFHGGGLTGGTRKTMPYHFEALTEKGIAVASVDYRLSPAVHFPVYIEDCARSVYFLLRESGISFGKVAIGGSSAGAYLSMMLLFDGKYLGKYGISPLSVDGWLLDAGQPTTHYRILEERGLDKRLIRMDEAAPLFFVNENTAPKGDGKHPLLFVICAENDIPCRPEQLSVLCATLLSFGWQKERIRFVKLPRYHHCEYNKDPVFFSLMESLMADA